ncbi:MAG: methionine--tRNA ligase [Armatimonadota bacterium]|nr:methionine--tRNA ligase [Armatimonadota bacterium]MDR7533241.1 methionine--tRNA ligase [Armatimonadota bacterium]MDR7536966.1 methionine--tRNA ligase [Armatimonadota bacterium]
MERFFITTAIDYVNASPHIGHAYEKIVADALARYHRLFGHAVFFLTGTDEHGQKNVTSARAAGRDVREFVDANAARFRELIDLLHLSVDDFIRTTEARHAAGVRAIWTRVAAAGDFYRKNYRALYCVGHEAFVTLSDLVDGRCPDHGTEPVVIEEENYFFRLSKYRPHLRRLFESRPDFVLPATRHAEMLNLIDTLEDISVSRPVEKLAWGIPVPGDPSHVIYVWFDALTNYISAIGFGSDEARFRQWWPAHHLIGKDINRFHSLLWPAMLLSAGLEPPRQVLVHGFLTVEGQKMSKTLGNVVDPGEAVRALAARAGTEAAVAVDALRYFLLREIPFGEDGDFNRAGLVQRFNADLANDYGNLLHRTLSLVARDFQGRVPAPGAEEGGDRALRTLARAVAEALPEHVARVNLSQALAEVWRLLGAANKYLDDEAPWSVRAQGRPERAGAILYNTLEAVRIATILLHPVLPVATQRIWRQLGVAAPLEGQRLDDTRRWGGLEAGQPVAPGAPVFPRIDVRRPTAAAVPSPAGAPVAGPSAAVPAAGGRSPDRAGALVPTRRAVATGEGGSGVTEISIEEFRRIDLRVAEVTAAERVPGTDKLLRLVVDLGDEVRTVVAGIAAQYTPADLVGRKIVVVANLQPRRVRGVESRGMLLAATWGDDEVAILGVDARAPKGARVT